MCFKKEFDPAKGPPPRKPDFNAEQGGSILGSIFNSAKNVFDGITSIELQRFEAKRLADIREIEEQAKIARQKELAGMTLPDLTQQQQIAGGAGLLAIVLLGTAAVLIATR